MKILTPVLAFLIEIVVIIAFGYWGFHLSNSTLVHWGVGLGAPLVVIVLWWRFAAPKASGRLSRIPLLIFKIIIFTLSAIAFFAAGSHKTAFILEAIALLSAILSFVWE